jgi:hypothetical protein
MSSNSDFPFVILEHKYIFMSVAGEGVHRHHNPDHDEREENEARCQSPPFGIEPTRVFNNTSNDEEDEIELPTTNMMMASSQERTPEGLHPQNSLQYQEGGGARPLTPTVMMGGPIPSTVPCPATTDRHPSMTSPLSQASSAQLQPHPRSQQAIESSVVTAFSYHPVSD